MNNRLNNPAVVLASGLLFLTACGGGGGGGGSAPTSATATAAPPSPNAGLYISFQTDSATITYPMASATALVTNAGTGGVAAAASGQGATMTLTTNGGAFNIAFNVPTTGSTFTQQYASSVWEIDNPIDRNAPAAAYLATILRLAYGSPNRDFSEITQSIGPQSLNSAAYGFWASGDTATTGRAGTFAFGNLTPTASVPSTGSATFNGLTIGAGGASSGSTVYALEGKAQIIANFASQSVTTSLTNLSTQNISTNAVGSLPNLTGTSAMSGNAYSGPIGGTGLTGTINGNFYGSAAQETAGVWQASGAATPG